MKSNFWTKLVIYMMIIGILVLMGYLISIEKNGEEILLMERPLWDFFAYGITSIFFGIDLMFEFVFICINYNHNVSNGKTK